MKDEMTKYHKATTPRVQARVEYEQAKMFFGINSPEALLARSIWQRLKGDGQIRQAALAVG
ncbi:MAG: hypothetical protein R3245_00345 [Kiloniellales bacterium]|nr:hypothetical protein [Kiloniellales bacterium]